MNVLNVRLWRVVVRHVHVVVVRDETHVELDEILARVVDRPARRLVLNALNASNAGRFLRRGRGRVRSIDPRGESSRRRLSLPLRRRRRLLLVLVPRELHPVEVGGVRHRIVV